jgi:prophage tail gpP-like protein
MVGIAVKAAGWLISMLEIVTISGVFAAMKSISITRSAEQAVSHASGEFVIVGPGLPVLPDDDVTIMAGGTLLLTGYVDNVTPSYDARGASRTLGLSFVSRTVDATETSVDHESGEIKDQTLADIGRAFDTLGIGIEDDGGLPVEPRHKLEPGESLFSTLERRARGRGILIHDTPEGKLKLATKPAGQHAGTLRRGVNIERASATLTGKDRYSDVTARGQTTIGSDSAQLRPQAVAKDTGVRRRRPLIVRHEGEVTTDRLKKRAEWHTQRGAGNAVTASITTTGWRDEGGTIWTPNFLVQVEDDWIGISGLMIIKSVQLEQQGDGGQGTTATLSLADPRALGGENPRGSTDAGYAAPTPSATFETQ